MLYYLKHFFQGISPKLEFSTRSIIEETATPYVEVSINDNRKTTHPLPNPKECAQKISLPSVTVKNANENNNEALHYS